MKYAVLSYGRPEVQLTLQNIPASLLHTVELWVTPKEYTAYKAGWYASKVKSINCWPTYIDCAPKKRKWAALNFNEDYMLIDDDLSLYVWSKKHDKFVKPELSPKRFEREWLEEIPSLFSTFPGVSLGNKFMADPYVRENGVMKPNNVGFCFSGFAKDSPKDKLLYNRVFAFTDISLPLQMFQRTGKSLIYYGLCYNHASHPTLATSGMSSYRDDFVIIDSAIKMGQLFPGIVTGLKNTGNKGGGATLTKFFSRVKKKVSDNNLKATEKWLEEMKAYYGLSRLPKLFEYDDHMPRADIIELFQWHWKRAKQ
jgi:hypothetical protein